MFSNALCPVSCSMQNPPGGKAFRVFAVIWAHPELQSISFWWLFTQVITELSTVRRQRRRRRSVHICYILFTLFCRWCMWGFVFEMFSSWIYSIQFEKNTGNKVILRSKSLCTLFFTLNFSKNKNNNNNRKKFNILTFHHIQKHSNFTINSN